MTAHSHLPAGAELVRITETFDEHTTPRGLLHAHQLAGGVWARLVVHDGSLDFAFEDKPDEVRHLNVGDELIIPPKRRHRVLVAGTVRFALQFYKVPPTEEPLR